LDLNAAGYGTFDHRYSNLFSTDSQKSNASVTFPDVGARASKSMGILYLYFRHGLERLTPRVLHSLASKAIVDFGGFDEGSALAMSSYADRAYAFEICPENIRIMTQIHEANPMDGRNALSLHAGVTNRTGRVCVPSCVGQGTNLKARRDPCQKVGLVPVDNFAESHNITVGFIKVDIEGHAFENGAGWTTYPEKAKAIPSISCYHGTEELFDRPLLLS
jgi:FkbM family methyltransferase